MSKADRGFASMDKDKQRAIASKGGKAAHRMGKAHEWDSESAAAAGRKGGIASKGGRAAILNNQPPTTDKTEVDLAGE